MENVREIVNGKLLPQFNNKKVSISGLVSNCSSNGLSFDIKTVDDMNVRVTLKKPLQGLVQDYVEVHGTSQGSSVLCDEIVEFKSEDGDEQFHTDGHNSLCGILNSIPRLWDLN